MKVNGKMTKDKVKESKKTQLKAFTIKVSG